MSAKMLKLMKNVKKLHFRKFSTSSEKEMPRPNSAPVEATMIEHNRNKWDWEQPVISVADAVTLSCSFAFGVYLSAKSRTFKEGKEIQEVAAQRVDRMKSWFFLYHHTSQELYIAGFS